MTFLASLPLLIVLADAPKEARWELAADDDGVKVYSRPREGQNINEMKAMGLVDAAPQEVWKMIRDYENYAKAMPYTEVSKVLSQDANGKVIMFYTVVNAPLVDRRDYVLKIVDDSEWKDGAGFLKTSWSASPDADTLAPLKKDIVRVRLNDGYWLLEPRENGTKTFATYYVVTDPGGSIPKWIANKGNNTAVPKVFSKIREGVAKKK